VLARRFDAMLVLLSPKWSCASQRPCQADVLVIGNEGMDRRVLGSVPNTVTHEAACSVFIVKTPQR
jgi:nucleotide-binding universal stress UspA family protein